MRDLVVTWWPTLSNVYGRRQTLSWSALCEQLSNDPGFRGDDHPGWSPAEFTGDKRALANVKRVHALCLDYDNGTNIGAACDLWLGFEFMLHTTRKHTASKPRFRIVLPLVCPVSAEEYGELWLRANAYAENRLDPAPKDAGRFWYMPGSGGHDGAEFQCTRSRGNWLDPDDFLERHLPNPKPLEPAQREHREDASTLERRATAYLAKMPPAISGQGGHQATWEAALYLARGFGLNEEQTYRLLLEEYNPRCQPAWSEKELRHKARDAANANLPHGFKLDEPDRYHRSTPLPRAPWSGDDEPPEWYQDEPEELPADPEPTPPGEIQEGEAELQPAVKRYALLSQFDLLSAVHDAMRAERPDRGVPTGDEEIDAAIGCYRRGNVTFLGAKRRFGKTSYSIMVSDYALSQKPARRVLLIAGEDSAMMYGKRYMALRSSIKAMALRDLDVDARDIANAAIAVDGSSRVPFFRRSEGQPVEWIAKLIRDVCRECDIELVIVDYLQCIRAAHKQQDRRNEVTYVARTLVDAIKNANAAGLILSQLKRTERSRPELEDLKESGDIEDMAEHVLLGWLDEKSDPTRRVMILAKNKDGPGDLEDVDLRFDKQRGCFLPKYGFAGRTNVAAPDDWEDDFKSRAAGDWEE